MVFALTPHWRLATTERRAADATLQHPTVLSGDTVVCYWGEE